MRIAFLCYEAFSHGGIRTYARELLPRICAIGHEVTLFFPGHTLEERNFPSNGIDDLPVKTMDLPFFRAPSFWWNLPRQVRELERKTGKFDIIHSNIIADLMLRKRNGDPPRIVTAFHLGLSTLRAGRMRSVSGISHPSSEYGPALAAQSICLRRADHIITISQFTRQEILSYYREIPEETISIVYPGISPSAIITDPRALANARNLFGLRATDRVILFAGRLEKRKGLKALLYAFREIRKKEQATLVITGMGDQRPW